MLSTYRPGTSVMTIGHLRGTKTINRTGETIVAKPERCLTPVIHRQNGDDYGVAQTLHNLGMTHAGQRKWKEALACYAEGEGLGREMGTVDVLANILVSRAMVQVDVNDLDGAETSYQGAQVYFEQMQDALGLAECAKIQGIVLLERGHPVQAAVTLVKCRRGFSSLDNGLGVAECEVELGRARRARGDIEEAQSFYQAAIAHFQELGADVEADRARNLLATL